MFCLPFAATWRDFSQFQSRLTFLTNIKFTNRHISWHELLNAPSACPLFFCLVAPFISADSRKLQTHYPTNILAHFFAVCVYRPFFKRNKTTFVCRFLFESWKIGRVATFTEFREQRERLRRVILVEEVEEAKIRRGEKRKKDRERLLEMDISSRVGTLGLHSPTERRLGRKSRKVSRGIFREKESLKGHI